MKTKITWEVADIRGGVWTYRASAHPGLSATERLRHQLSTAWMIGFDDHPSTGDARYRLVSLADGMITKGYTKEEMAAKLTREDAAPLPPELLVRLIEFHHSR